MLYKITTDWLSGEVPLTFCLTSTEARLLIRDGEKVGGRAGVEVGGRGRSYTHRYTVTTTCIKMGSDESHFNVS